MGIGKMNKKSRSISNRDLLYSTTSSKSIEKKKSLYFKADFTPVLNKNSLKIAERIGNSFERLTSKRSRSFNNVIDLSTIVKKMSSKFLNSTLGHSLYDRAMNTLRIKRKRISNMLEREENEFKKHTYSPDLSLTSRYNTSRSLSNPNCSLYDRSISWITARNNKIERNKQCLIKKENEDLTLKPKLIKKEMKDDEKFINRFVCQINTYINRCESSKAKKKEFENYKEKVFKLGIFKKKSKKSKLCLKSLIFLQKAKSRKRLMILM